MSTVSLDREARYEEFLAYEGRAELIDDEIVPVSPSGHGPAYASLLIGAALLAWGRTHQEGRAYSDGASFRIFTPRRQVLSPDAAWWIGTPDLHAPVIEGAPVFVAEVRSTTDYGPVAERTMARKRALWFAGGVQVVWDVDALRQQVIRSYHADAPDAPVIYRQGEIANAEPAVPGWRFPVDSLFS